MRLAQIVLFALVLSPVAFAHAESAVHDSSGPHCFYGDPDATPLAGEIPANWPIFYINLAGGGFDRTTTTLVNMGDGHFVPLSFDAFGNFTPTEPLAVGATYVLNHPACSDVAPRTTIYTTTDPIPAPTTVGALAIRGPYAANRERGVANRYYFYEVELTPDPLFASAPWSGFHWHAELDGDGRYASVESMSTARARLALDCDGRGGAAPGTYELGASALAVFTDHRSIVNAETTTTTLTCSDVLRVDIDTLRPLTAEEILYWDGTEMDGGTAGLDGGTTDAVDGGLDGGRADMHTEPDTDTNCSASPGGGSRGLMWVLFGTAILLRRARARPTRRR